MSMETNDQATVGAPQRTTARPRAATQYPIGKVADFPIGSHKIVRAGTQQVGIFNVDGALHALVNVCPHQYGPVCTGPVGGEMICNARTDWRFHWHRDGEILTCPWHGLEFDLKSGRCLAASELRIRKGNVSIVDDEVRVSFGSESVDT